MNLRKLRKEHHISQKELARAMSVAQNTVSNWETGKREPDNQTLQKIADFFSVSTDQLLGYRSEPSEPEPENEEILVLHRNGGRQVIRMTPEESARLVRLLEVAMPSLLDEKL